jgi:hypothetical protein
MPQALETEDPGDPLTRERLDSLRLAVTAGARSARAGRVIDGRVVENELRIELDRKLEQQQRRKGAGRLGS